MKATPRLGRWFGIDSTPELRPKSHPPSSGRSRTARFLAILGALIIPATAQDQLNASLNPDGRPVTITREFCPIDSLKTPSTIGGLKVSAIGDAALQGCDDRTSVTTHGGVAMASSAQFAVMGIQWNSDVGRFEVSCRGLLNHVYRLQRSDDLRTWTDLAVTHQRLAPYLLQDCPTREFYRTLASPLTADDDWKNQILATGTNAIALEPFLSRFAEGSSERLRWIKFLILLEDPHRVYFQASSKYAFHYEFARARLPSFARVSVDEFEAMSLHRDGQKVVLGTLLFPQAPFLAEVGIQFAGYDAFTSEQVAEWFHQVKSRVLIRGLAFYYLPVFEQAASSKVHAAELAARGVPVVSLERWVVGNQCYSRGWALGRLVYLPSAQISAAYTNGRLLPSDILLTDAVPADIPPVIGILCLSPAALNSHVAILALSSGVPFGYVADPSEQAQLLAWNGDEVLLMVNPTDQGSVIKAFKADRLSSDQRRQLLELKQPARLNITPMASAGRITLPAAGLVPADLRYVGGKAASFGVLARSIPENTPTNAIAFTFDLWNSFLNQEIAAGKTLRQWIDEKLSALPDIPANLAALHNALSEIRRTITQDADFTPEQKRDILQSLSIFDTQRNLRFRSSTNVEDIEAFTGAGLYDSYSGCLADDLDADAFGPSHCDPTEAQERGVFRAIRKVYASYYNNTAYLERRRRGVQEEEAGMGILVHLSAPDEIEDANGVATLSVTQAQDPALRNVSAKLVTQPGAVSVANPEANVKPEIIDATWSGWANPALTLEQHSGLLPWGGKVLDWPKDYDSLLALLDSGARAYANLFPERQTLVLNFEYKKLNPGRLMVKQIRELRTPAQVAPLLIPDAGDIVVLQYGSPWDITNERLPIDVLSNHRLKGSWRFEISRLDEGLLTELTLRMGDAIFRATGPLGSLPGARMDVEGHRVQYAFVHGEGISRRTVRLGLNFPWDMENNPPPLVFLSDAVMDLRVDYETPQQYLGTDGEPTSRTNEMVLLEPREALLRDNTSVTLSMTAGSLTVESEFDYWNLYSRGPYRGDSLTEAVAHFRETRLLGLASKPILLRSDFSQSFATGHHNFGQYFLFEPGMEPGMDPQILAELRSANIKMIWAQGGFLIGPKFGTDWKDCNGSIVCQGCDTIAGRPSPWLGIWQVRVVGYDGTWREW